jgi:hypothetical protein
MRRAQSLSLRAPVANAHISGAIFCAVGLSPFLGDLFEFIAIVFLGCQIGLAFSAIEAAIGQYFCHNSSSLSILLNSGLGDGNKGIGKMLMGCTSSSGLIDFRIF